MSKRLGYLLIAIIIVLLAVISYLLIFQTQTNKPQAANQTASKSVNQEGTSQPSLLPSPSTMALPTVATPLTPEGVVRQFYTQYILALANPYRTSMYKTNRLLSDRFKQNIANMKSVGANNDPILCTFNKTNKFTIDPVQIDTSNSSARVTLRRSDGQIIYKFALIQINGSWIINDTFCIPVPNTVNQ